MVESYWRRRLLDRIVAGEENFLRRMQAYQPIMEIYVQTGTGLGRKKRFASDQYAIGRVSVGDGGLEWSSFTESEGFLVKGRKSKFGGHGGSVGLLSRGFAQMIMPDAFSFDRTSYEFSFQRREFLGEVRTLVFEVKPRTDKAGRFVGRIWVEERSTQIVRFNGTYSGVVRNGVFPALTVGASMRLTASGPRHTSTYRTKTRRAPWVSDLLPRRGFGTISRSEVTKSTS
jgi:hypothetical protein